MRELLRDMRDNNILLEVVDGKLKVFAGEMGIDPKLLSAIKERQEELLQFLSDNNHPDAGNASQYIPVAPEQPHYPLSSAQRRLWLLSQLPEGSQAYHMIKAFVLEGELNEAALENAFQSVIGRHESLRTVFREDETGAVRQFVLPPEQSGFRLVQMDFREEANQAAAIENVLKQQQEAPFDLTTGPLTRAVLIRISSSRWLFAYVMHHIISDGWSMGIMIGELLQLYKAAISGQEAALNPLYLQYKDYAVWQQGSLEEEAAAYHKTWWLQQFSGELPVLALPVDHQRPAVRNYHGDVVRTIFRDDLATKMNALTREEGGTLFMGLLSLVYVLLHRYSGQEDIIIGSPVAGRDHADLEEQIGVYINILALRGNIDGRADFRKILAAIRQLTVDAYAHQSYPFDELVSALNLSRDMSRNALFDVMVILQHNDNYQSLAGNQLSVSSYQATAPTTSKFDLNFVFIDTEGKLGIEIEYNTDLYERATIERLAAHLEQLLEAVTAQPDIPVEQLDYLPAAEKQLLAAFNDSNTDFTDGKTLMELFEAQVQDHPDNIVLVFEEVCMSYRELNETANRLGHYLRDTCNIGPDDLVAVKMPRSEKMIIAILGALKAGGAYMPVDPDYPQERISYLMADSRCKIMLDEEALGKFEQVKEQYSPENPAAICTSTHLAYVIYTSGSTGQPKGCMLEHRGVINRIEWMWQQFGFNRQDIILQKTTFTFDVSVWEIFMPLCWGVKMILCTKDDIRSPEQLSHLIEKHGITCLHFVPGMFNAFIRALENNPAGIASLRSLQRVITSGEALLPETVRAWYSLSDVPICNLYGPTEASVDVTYYVANPGDTVIPIGKPIWNTQLYILDTSGQQSPVGIAGEICIAGAGLARGYLHQPQLTAEKFVVHNGERIYKTGDLGRWLPDGNIEFLGRADNQVKIRGYRIELGEIESALHHYPGIDNAVVVTREREKGEKELVAYLAGKTTLNIDHVRQHLLNLLPAYMIPGYFVSTEKLPLTSSGKIDRRKLHEINGLQASGVAYVPPVTELEKAMIDIVEEVTGHRGAGMNDSFFSLGGDSIKVITFAVNVKKRLGIEVSVKGLYEARTLSDWAAYLQAQQKEHHRNSVYKYLATGLEEISRIKSRIEEENKQQQQLPAVYEDIYPVVQIEQGMIISSLMNPAEPVYYDQYSFTIRIDDLDRFRDRMIQMVRRHPILRTKYYVSSFSQPVKVVLPEIALPLTFEDISAQSPEEQAATVRAYVESDLSIRLSFDDELLWRINLFQLNAHDYCLTYSVHHAMVDGWSMAVFKTEIADPNGEVLPPLPYSYKDYSAIVLGRKQSGSTAAYWQQFLGGYTRNKLPFNYKGLKISGETGMRKVSRSIDKQLLDALAQLTVSHQLSFKAICLAAHVYLMHLICSEQDVVTGVVTHERPEIEGGENMLGCFLTTIPIRIKFEELTDILSLLKQVNSYISDVKPHETHLSEIAASIGERTVFGNPVFDTLLNYTDFHTFGKIGGNDFINILQAGENNSEMEVSHEMTNTLFDVEVSKTLDRFSARIKYAPAYFIERDVKYALDLYVRILEHFAANVHAPVAGLQLLTQAESAAILTGFNATAAPYAAEKSIHRIFEEQAMKTPDAIALRQDGISMRYHRLNEQANRLAHYLISMGVKKGDNVGLLVTRSFGMIVGMYGILKAGGAYVPVDPDYPVDRQQYIIQNSGVQTIVTSDAALTAALEGITAIVMGEEVLEKYEAGNPEVSHHSRDLAYTIYTSGSTGRPKGVMIEHHAVINVVEWVNETFSIGAEDRLLFITSMCFDLSVYDIFGILAAGGTVVIARNDEVREISVLKRLLKEEAITCWDSVPTTMNYLVTELEAGAEDFLQQDLRLVLLSGDWIPVQLPGRIHSFFPAAHVISLGGATEGTVWSNYYPIGEVNSSWSSIPYGKPIKNNAFYILNDQLQPVPGGVTGELFIGGVGVARGYANDPEKTAASFLPDPFNDQQGGIMYKTGDLGRMLPDGNMEFLGRKDNQVKIRGFRVELGEIESTLLRHHHVKGAIVHVFKDADGLNQLCAYLLENRDLDVQAVKQFLQEQLPAYMIPSHFMILDAFPLNSNGKIDRKALPGPAEDRSGTMAAYVPPVTDTEKQVTAIWTSILNIERISVEEDLFRIGANSLSVGAFVNRIQRRSDITVNIREIFINPTIAAIAAGIDKRRWVADEFSEAENINDVENFSI